jgi:hypothetical protein
MSEERARGHSLEDRLRAIEDRLEIYNLIASHPPSADTGADYFSRAVFAEDAVLDLGGDKKAAGKDAIAAIVTTPGHQAAIAGGLAHFTGLPHITLDGDEAVVTSYLQILAPHPSAEPIEVPIMASRRAFASTGSEPTAGSWCAPPPAGRSSAARCARSTARRRRARFSSARSRHSSRKRESELSLAQSI